MDIEDITTTYGTLSGKNFDIMSSSKRAVEGIFIAFEGGEGSGKSTQSKLLADRLTSMGYDVLHTREPGGCNLNTLIRQILLEGDDRGITQKTELFLFLADRAQHVETVIRPALERGEIVICDRYEASTIAYQCYAGGLDLEFTQKMSRWSSQALTPDVTYFLDVPVLEGLERAKRVERTRFEDKTVEYHRKVHAGYRAQISSSWRTHDATESIEEIHYQISQHVVHLIDRVYGVTVKTETVIPSCPVCNVPMTREKLAGFNLICQNGHGTMTFTPNV